MVDIGTLDYSAENWLRQHKNCRSIVGIDEVGRGPWAGPVVAAAVILNPDDLPLAANDSKKLTARQREKLYPLILEKACVGIGEASVAEIDEHNILAATFIAMRRAVENLPVAPDFSLIDGNKIPKDWMTPAHAVVQGDGKVLSIACASIVAKVYRDNLMAKLAEQHPHYGWERNAGYGAPMHQQGLASHGVTPHHRRSFAPIAKLLSA